MLKLPLVSLRCSLTLRTRAESYSRKLLSATQEAHPAASDAVLVSLTLLGAEAPSGASWLNVNHDPKTSMPRRDPARFTRKETIERIQALKSYLAIKERLALRFAPGLSLLPSGYDPSLEESFYLAPRLEQSSIDVIRERLTSLRQSDWWSESSIKKVIASSFVDTELSGSAEIGSVIDIVFYPWKADDMGKRVATKYAVFWIGTWHHAPQFSWCNSNSLMQVYTNYLPAYSDLIK